MKKNLLFLIVMFSIAGSAFADNTVIQKTYYDTGELKCEIPVKNNVKHGVVKCYYKSGALQVQFTMNNNKEDGITRFYYENGKLKSEAPFKNGKKEGTVKYYYENGAFSSETQYKNNKRNGKEIKYNRDGSIFAIVINKDDNVISGECGNGRKWNNAEIHNWNNDLSVSCQQ